MKVLWASIARVRLHGPGLVQPTQVKKKAASLAPRLPDRPSDPSSKPNRNLAAAAVGAPPTREGLTMAPPPELIDDVAAEIFLRLPPDEPEHLVRASLACKPWLRIISDPGFLRRYRAFHRTPPLLGYIQRRAVVQGDPEPRLIPTTAVPLGPNPTFRRALDCRHGRVLVHVYGGGGLLVWDPVTGDRQVVPNAEIDWLIYTAAVFCAVSGCDHIDCHGGPFLVVFLATDDHDELVKASVYSSETGAWSMPVSLGNDCETYVQHRRTIIDALRKHGGWHYTPYVQPKRGAVVGDGVYFTLRDLNAIIKYDYRKNCLSMINPPSDSTRNIALMELEDSSLGFAYIKDATLYLWSRKVNSEAAEWVKCSVIKLKSMVPLANPSDKAFVVGAAEGVGVIFVSTGVGLFTIKLNSGQVKKVDEPEVYYSILPYMSFYTPDCGKIIARKAEDSLITDVPLN
ncbi:hypothetical protein EJB05_14353, partial [Eragrostis curvula]